MLKHIWFVCVFVSLLVRVFVCLLVGNTQRKKQTYKQEKQTRQRNKHALIY
jgi:cytochrome c biogenesis protein ResB